MNIIKKLLFISLFALFLSGCAMLKTDDGIAFSIAKDAKFYQSGVDGPELTSEISTASNRDPVLISLFEAIWELLGRFIPTIIWGAENDH